MKPLLVLINIMSSLLASLCMIYLFRSVYEYKFKNRQQAVFILVFGLANGLFSSLMQPFAFKPLILIVLSSALMWFLLKTTVFQAVFAFSLYVIAVSSGNALLPIIFNLIMPGVDVATMQNNVWMALASNIFVNLLAFVFFMIIKPVKYYIKLIINDKFLFVFTAATLVLISTSFALYIYSKSLNMSIYLLIAMINTLYCIFILLMWLNSLRRVMREEDLKQQKFYNDSLRSTLYELRRFRHDWTNNLIVIDSMIKMNKYNELKQYMSELMDQCSRHNNAMIYDIRNAGLFGILSSKIGLAEEKGITVDLKIAGDIENIPGIKISELCEVIGIFMDNAIEEASTGDKSISVSLKNEPDFIEISISNTCSESPDIYKIYNEGYSSKGENRGMGLTIAKKILERYKNILHITSCENNVFTQTIEIANSK
jgi:two-component system sensor histidine kinase AgrC